MKFTVQKLDK